MKKTSFLLHKLLYENRIYFLLLLLFYVVAGFFLVYSTRIDIHLWFNSFHVWVTDWFFRYFTEIGNGITVFIIAVILFFFDKKLAYAIGLSSLFAGLTAQLLKHFVFPNVMRPSAVIPHLYLVSGLHMNKMFSFPSGHTAVAFAMFSVLIFYFSKKRLKLLFFLFAFLVGYSRIYLSQHFLVDVYFGSIIGTIFAIVIYIMFFSKKLRDNEANR